MKKSRFSEEQVIGILREGGTRALPRQCGNQQKLTTNQRRNYSFEVPTSGVRSPLAIIGFSNCLHGAATDNGRIIGLS